MAERILAENKHLQTVSYSLPNKHYIPVDMRYAGIDNLTPCVSNSVSCPSLAFCFSHGLFRWQLGSVSTRFHPASPVTPLWPIPYSGQTDRLVSPGLLLLRRTLLPPGTSAFCPLPSLSGLLLHGVTV